MVAHIAGNRGVDGRTMGLCLSTFRGSVIDHAPSGQSTSSAAAVQDANALPPHRFASEKGASAKNLVAPHPVSPQRSPIDAAARQAVKAGSKETSAPMKRSQTLAVHGSSKRSPADANTNPFAAAKSSKQTVPQEQNSLDAEATASSPRSHASSRPTLQHSTSEANVESLDGNWKQMRRPKKPVTVGVDVLFRDERARLGFFKYLHATALQEKLKDVRDADGNRYDSEEFRKRRMSKLTSSRFTTDYREHCVLFWLEMSDLLKIPSGGSFQLGLMNGLFDVYIAQGSLRQLPMVSAAEREPLAQHLQDKNVERALLPFKMVLLDALEVVTTHFDEYIRADGQLGYTHATKSASMRNVLARLAKVSFGTSGDRRSHLNEILNTPALCRLFRGFLQDRNSVEALLFIIDALTFEDFVHTFDQEPGLRAARDGSHHDYCLRQAQKIFNKYIRFGSKAEICLSGAVKGKLLREIVEYPLGAEVFNDAVLLCSAELVHSHLDPFYSTSGYIAYSAAKKRQASVKTSASTTKRSAPDAGSGVSSDASAGAGSARGDGNEAFAKSDQMYTGTGPLLSLLDIVDGSGANYLREFLKEEGLEHMLLFYKEVAEFQLLPHGQKHYIQCKARKIFDRFVRRGGKLEVELPADVRRDILWKLSAPTEHTFSDAQKYVFTFLEHNYLDTFRHHKLYLDMMTALHKLPHFGVSSGGVVDMKASSHAQGGTSRSSSGDWVDVAKIPLREFLDVAFLRRFFRLFLEKEQCANELYFYVEIVSFQQFPTSDYLSRQAKKLFHRFCDPASREFVACEPAIRTEIQTKLSHPSPAMFNKVQEEILSFFATTLFPKFQQSEVYRTIRTTTTELQTARLVASGDGSSEEIQGRGGGRHGAIEDSATAVRPATVASRVRNSGAVEASPRQELAEDQVTVALILEHQETRALFLFFSEEMCVAHLAMLRLLLCLRLTRALVFCMMSVFARRASTFGSIAMSLKTSRTRIT